VLVAADGKPRIFLGSTPCNLNVGGPGDGGRVLLVPASATGIAPAIHHTISMDADTASITFQWGGQGSDSIDGANGNMWLGGNGSAEISCFFRPSEITKRPTKRASRQTEQNGNIRLGCTGVAGNLALFPAEVTAASLHSFDNAAIHLNGQTGDILLGNCGLRRGIRRV